MDVKTAFSHFPARRPNFIEVPTEDPGSKLHGASPKVVGSLCGTRNTPLIWQDCFRCQMKVLGFSNLLRAPCMFHHETKKGVDMMAHVDDQFVVVLERCSRCVS